MTDIDLGDVGFASGVLTMVYAVFDSWRHRHVRRDYVALTRSRIARILAILLPLALVAAVAYRFDLRVGFVPVGAVLAYAGACYVIYLFWRHWCCLILQFIDDQHELVAAGRRRSFDREHSTDRSTP